jgi:hypothetical protein
VARPTWVNEPPGTFVVVRIVSYNKTVILFDAQDIADAKKFASSADLKSTMP